MNSKKEYVLKRIGVVLVASQQKGRHCAFLRVGDFVDLKTQELREEYFDELGAGPYQVTAIGEWNNVIKVLFVRSENDETVPINPEMVYRVSDREMKRPLTYEEMVLFFENRPEFSEFRDSPAEIYKTISEFDVLLQYCTYLDVSTNTVRSRFYSEHIIQEMIRTRNFLARYIGLSANPPIPAVLC